MREILERNGCAPERRRELHLHAHARPRRRVPRGRRARSIGLRRACRCCARGRSPCPGALPRVIRVLIHYYADEDHAPRTSTWARPARCAPTSGRAVGSRTMAIEFAERVRRIPVYPAADGYALPERRRAAGLATSRPYPPLPAGASRRSRGARRRSTATRTRRTRRCARALSDRYGVPADADRDRQRLLRHPARRRRGAARARRRARLRVAVVLRLPAPRGRLRRARAIARAARRRRTATTSTAMRAEITVATRLVIVCNPNNPTSTALPLERRSPPSSTAVPRHVCVILDEAYCEFNMLDDPDASLDLLDAPPEPRPAADVLEGLRPVRAARRLRAVRLGGASAPPSTRCASRSSATPPRRPPRVEALAPPGRGRRAASSATVAERIALDDGLRALGLRAGRVAGQLRAGSTCARGRDEAGDRARPRRARRARPRRRRARPRRARCA